LLELLFDSGQLLLRMRKGELDVLKGLLRLDVFSLFVIQGRGELEVGGL